MVTLSNIHADYIHDADLDYYGRRLATVSSDHTVKIFEVNEKEDTHRLMDTLRGHELAVWQVAWGHPKFGGGSGSGLLASCGYDGKVLIWREEKNGSWSQVGAYTEHLASVNSIAWAPVEYGPLLACGSSDGRVSVLEIKTPETNAGSVQVEQVALFPAHQIGTNSVSWAPYQDSEEQPRFVSGGSDNLAKIWKFNGKTYELESTLDAHSNWVRDATWSPSMLSKSYIATGGQDKQVFIWTQEPGSKKWEHQPLRPGQFPDIVWRLSWSLSGNILAVSGTENKVTLWKEGLKGKWDLVEEITE